MAVRPVVIVTGASSGIGKETAVWLGAKKANVTVVARSAAPLEQTASAVKRRGGNCLTVAVDIADPDKCRRVVDDTLDRFGSLSAVVNNAGILTPLAPVSDSTPGQWRYNIEVNLLGPVYMAMAALTELEEQRGRIINVSSGAALHVIATASAYCAAKAALNHFTRILAAEAPSITAVAIRPGVVDTPMQELLRTDGATVMSADQAAYYQALQRDGRLEPPSVPARVLAWLALEAPAELSGDFLDYDDPRISLPAHAYFAAGS